MFWHVFVFSNRYEYAFWMKWKLHVTFSSVHSINRTGSLNILQMTTLKVKQFTSFDITYHTRMIYKPIHIKNMFWTFVLKQIKFTWKPDVSFWGQYTMYKWNCYIQVPFKNWQKFSRYLSRLMTKPTMWLCAQRRLRSARASAQSDQSLRCALNG